MELKEFLQIAQQFTQQEIDRIADDREIIKHYQSITVENYDDFLRQTREYLDGDTKAFNTIYDVAVLSGHSGAHIEKLANGLLYRRTKKAQETFKLALKNKQYRRFILGCSLSQLTADILVHAARLAKYGLLTSTAKSALFDPDVISYIKDKNIDPKNNALPQTRIPLELAGIYPARDPFVHFLIHIGKFKFKDAQKLYHCPRLKNKFLQAKFVELPSILRDAEQIIKNGQEDISAEDESIYSVPTDDQSLSKALSLIPGLSAELIESALTNSGFIEYMRGEAPIRYLKNFSHTHLRIAAMLANRGSGFHDAKVFEVLEQPGVVDYLSRMSEVAFNALTPVDLNEISGRVKHHRQLAMKFRNELPGSKYLNKLELEKACKNPFFLKYITKDLSFAQVEQAVRLSCVGILDEQYAKILAEDKVFARQLKNTTGLSFSSIPTVEERKSKLDACYQQHQQSPTYDTLGGLKEPKNKGDSTYARIEKR